MGSSESIENKFSSNKDENEKVITSGKNTMSNEVEKKTNMEACFKKCKKLFEDEIDATKITPMLIEEAVIEPEDEEMIQSQKKEGVKVGAALWELLNRKLNEDEIGHSELLAKIKKVLSKDYKHVVETMESQQFKEEALREWRRMQKKSKPKKSSGRVVIIGSNNTVMQNSSVTVNNYHQ